MAASRDKILRDAEKLVQRGKVEQAIREYEKLLKSNPTDANTINRVGDLYGRVGQIDKAVELYERIADHFTQDGFHTKAIAILKKINRLAPQRLDIFDRLAELYIQQGLVVEAKSQYQILADWYVKSGDHEQAITTHKKLVQLDPNNHMAHLRLADLLIQQGEAEEALEVYDKLGRVLLERDKLDEAERLYRHALEQNPPNGEFLAPLCEALLEAGRSTSAREFLDAAIRHSPDSPALQSLQVRTHLVFGEADKALQRAEQVLDAQPENDEVRNLVGRALLSSGKLEEAREMLLPVCEQLLGRGEFMAAQKLLQELLNTVPQDHQVLSLAVKAYRPSGDQEKLLSLTESLADSCFHNERLEQAGRLYMELLEAQPQNDLFRERLAQIQGVEPDQIVIEAREEESTPLEMVAEEPEIIEVEEAEGAAEPVEAPPEAPATAEEVDEVDQRFDPEERLAEAKVFAKYGLLEKATTHLEEIIRFFPDEIEARAILVSLHVEQGDTEAALPVAEPLYQHYVREGDDENVQTLLASLPELEQPVAVGADVDDDVIVLDLDAAAEAEPIEADEAQQIAFDEPIPATAEPPTVESLEAESEHEVVLDEPEEVLVEPELAAAAVVDEEASEPSDLIVPVAADEPETAVDADLGPSVAAEALADDFVIDLDAVSEEVAEDEFEPEPVSAAEALSPSAEEFDEEELAEELVEISDGLSGPAIADLDQLDFFIEQDLHEDAIRLLGRLESEHPEDREVAERRLELKAKGVLLEEVVAVADGPEELFADEEESYVDLAKELERELAEEEAMVDEATGRGKEEAELEEVFREFQKGVAEQLSETDTDTHFNLGIAYKEMGLLPEAIREFQVSARDPKLFVECCSMIGVCYVEQGMWGQAADWYEKALAAPDLTPDADLALRYDLAAALQSGGDHERAADLYGEIAAANPAYRDVSNRLSSLSEHRQAN